MTSEPALKAPGPIVSDWHTPSSTPALRTGALHLWKWALNDGTAPNGTDRHLLSVAELQRAESLSNPRIRENFILNRAAKRRILAGYLGVAPTVLEFSYGARGKPFIIHPESTLGFNLTHSGGLSLLAVSKTRAIGVDLERVAKRKNMQRVAKRMFGDRRSQHLASVPESERLQLFYAYWTWLEACVKARGGGLFDPASRQAQGLYHVCFVPHPGYQACFASSEPHLHRQRWQALLYAGSIASQNR